MRASHVAARRPKGSSGPSTLSSRPDAELLLGAQRGDVEAFTRLLARHRANALRFATLWTHDEDEAEDLVQVAAWTAYRELGSVRGAFRPWFRQVVTNLCRDWSKNVRQRARCSLEDVPMVVPSCERTLERQEVQERVQRALRDLGDNGDILRRYLEGEPHAAIGRALGLSRMAVTVRAFRARQALAETLRVLADVA